MTTKSKDERFKEVATRRVNKVLKTLKSFSNCSNKRIYSWNEEDLRKIWAAIDREYKLCKLKFEESKSNDFAL